MSAPTATVSSWYRREVSREVGHITAIFAASVLSLLPGLARSGSRIFGWPGDSGSAMWIGWRIGRTLNGGHLPTRLPDIFWPYGLDLMASDGYGPNLLMGIFNVVTGSASWSYNLVLLTGVFITGWAGSYAAKQLGGGRGVRLLVALAAIATPIMSVRLFGHPHLTFIGMPMLPVAETLRALVRGERLRWVRLSAFLYATYLCGSGFLLAAGIVCAVVVGFLLVRERDVRNTLLRFGGATAVCVVGMIPFLLARSQYNADETAAGGETTIFESWMENDAVVYATEQLTFFVPPSLTMLDGPAVLRDAQDKFAPAATESSSFLGLLPVAGLAMLVLLRSRVRAPLLAASAAVYVLAAGPALKFGLDNLPVDRVAADGAATSGTVLRWLPFQVLRLVPGMDSLRTSGRFLCMLPFLAALGLVPAAEFLRTRWSMRRTALVSCALVAVAVPVTIWPVPTYQALPTGAVRASLETIAREAEPGDTVAVVPADCWGMTDTNRMMILHRRPMVGCLGPFSAVRWYSEMDLYADSPGIAALSCSPQMFGPRPSAFTDAPAPSTAALEDLRSRFGVRYLIVRDDFYGALCTPERAQQIRDFVATLPVMATNGNLTVIDLGKRAPA